MVKSSSVVTQTSHTPDHEWGLLYHGKGIAMMLASYRHASLIESFFPVTNVIIPDVLVTNLVTKLY